MAQEALAYVSGTLNWSRIVAVWLLIIAAETVHGALRQVYLAPLMGDFPARRLAVFTGILLIFAITWLCIRWLQLSGTRALIQAGALWATFTMLFEVGLGRALGYDWERIFADYDLAQGGLMGIGLLAMLFAPLLAARLRAEPP